MGEIIKYVHHGNEVCVDKDLIGKHREHCLCWRGCTKFKGGTDKGNCPVAQAVFENCVKFGIVSPVWECGQYTTE